MIMSRFQINRLWFTTKYIDIVFKFTSLSYLFLCKFELNFVTFESEIMQARDIFPHSNCSSLQVLLKFGIWICKLVWIWVCKLLFASENWACELVWIWEFVFVNVHMKIGFLNRYVFVNLHLNIGFVNWYEFNPLYL